MTYAETVEITVRKKNKNSYPCCKVSFFCAQGFLGKDGYEQRAFELFNLDIFCVGEQIVDSRLLK